MSTHRVPLANNLNAINSPRRATLASKRGRLDHEDDISPPKKRQNIGQTAASFRRAQKISVNEPEGRVFTERRDAPPRNQFSRKLLATQDGRSVPQARVEARPAELTGTNKEQVQNWKKHYRRVFPQFVFYFDGFPPDLSGRCKRMLLSLGAVRVYPSRVKLWHTDMVSSVMSNSSPRTSPTLLLRVRYRRKHLRETQERRLTPRCLAEQRGHMQARCSKGEGSQRKMHRQDQHWILDMRSTRPMMCYIRRASWGSKYGL